MSENAVLVTGACGEIGQNLISALNLDGSVKIVALDIAPDGPNFPKNTEYVQGSIVDKDLLQRLASKNSFVKIFHLAGVLSSHGERNPALAHQVNVEGSLNILEIARAQSESSGKAVRIIFPSTIAVYGFSKKQKPKIVSEGVGLSPKTMYGVNKLYIENLGRYYSENFGALTQNSGKQRIDFRGIRLPGILSADTVPTGGTSDYGPEMAHAAAQGKSYACFVTPEATLPFMAMPDAIRAMVLLSNAESARIAQRVYNVGSFSIRADVIRERVLKKFPNAKITFEPDQRRLDIVESWPSDLDDSAARKDWGWAPNYDADRTFNDYLFPGVLRHYAKAA